MFRTSSALNKWFGWFAIAKAGVVLLALTAMELEWALRYPVAC